MTRAGVLHYQLTVRDKFGVVRRGAYAERLLNGRRVYLSGTRIYQCDENNNLSLVGTLARAVTRGDQAVTWTSTHLADWFSDPVPFGTVAK